MIKAFDQESFYIEVRETMRPGHLGTTHFAKPVFGTIEQQIGHPLIVDALEPAEPAALVAELPGFQVVDDGADPPEHPLVVDDP
jgi:hypothetical protein